MGYVLIEKLLPVLQQMKWPPKAMATPLGRQTFEVGLEKVSSFQEDPKELVSALKIFQSGDSQPYAYAGIAYILVTASKENDGSFSQDGLNSAMEWLEKAQASEPEIAAINFIEALIYIYNGRLDDGRTILDYLQEKDPTNYYVNLAEIAYWQTVKDVEETVYWFGQATEAAVTIPQRMRLHSQLGDFYMESGILEEALKVYKEAIHFNNKNAQLWHKLSIIYWRMGEYDEADRCNQMALRLEDFPAAHKMEEALKKKLDSGLKSRLFGRSKS